MKITKTDGSGDVDIELQQGGSTKYVIGIDDTDNLFKIHSDPTLIDTSDFTIGSNGRITTGTWQGTPIISKYTALEGTEILSTGESGGTKFLRVDGDGTCSWQTAVSTTAINDLSDALVENNSLWLGNSPSGTTSTAEYNVAVGTTALDAITTGDKNVSIGYNSGSAITDGSANIFIGATAGETTTSVAKTVIIGSGAGSSNMTYLADGTVAIGYRACASLTDGSANTMIGYSGGSAITTGYNNTGIGYSVLSATTTGYKNTSIGAYSLDLQTSDYENTAVGYNSGTAVSGGTNLTLIGRNTGAEITSGDNIVCVGYDAGNNLQTGSDCIYLGYQSTASSSSVSNEIVIGKGLTGKGANTAYIGGSSAIYNEANTSTWSTTSDKRLKRNIEPCDIGLNEIEQIRIVKYQFKPSKETPKKHNYDSNKIRYGVIAQEIQEILPNTVSQDKDGWLSVNSDPLRWGTMNSIKELYTKYKSNMKQIKDNRYLLDTLKQTEKQLENQIETIEKVLYK